MPPHGAPGHDGLTMREKRATATQADRMTPTYARATQSARGLILRPADHKTPPRKPLCLPRAENELSPAAGWWLPNAGPHDDGRPDEAVRRSLGFLQATPQAWRDSKGTGNPAYRHLPVPPLQSETARSFFLGASASRRETRPRRTAVLRETRGVLYRIETRDRSGDSRARSACTTVLREQGRWKHSTRAGRC